jgi:hypothetical protein
MSDIPAGYGLIPGRGQENARAALAAAVAAGFPDDVVITVHDGYALPEKALKKYEDAQKKADEDDKPAPAAEKPAPKKPAPKKKS